MCVASLTPIFTRPVGTLQPPRPLGRVGSKFNWPSEDQCQRSHSKWVFVFVPHLKSKYNQLIVSKLSRKSAICPQRSPGLVWSGRVIRSPPLECVPDGLGCLIMAGPSGDGLPNESWMTQHDGSLFWCALSGPCDWILRDWSRAWPTLTWLAKLVGVSVSSSVQNTNFPHTLKPWNSRASVG